MLKNNSNLKVAIIHYWFVTWRGGEKVVESILKLYPHADVYTLFYDENTCGPYLEGHKIYTSNLNTSFFKRRHQKVFPLYPTGIRSLKLQDTYDLIVSSESGPAKGMSIPDNTPHLCYIHTPMRYCWGYTEDYLNSLPKWSRGVARFLFERLRRWDESTINNVTHYVANSENVKNRVKKYYNRDATVVYPPIALELFEKTHLIDKPLTKEGHYLSFGAITPYKRIDLLIETFNENGKKLVVIGSGSEKEKLEKISGPNIRFTGSLPWHEIEDLIHHARALLFPGEEDFGMIPLEVMAYGVPVIAFAQGGALETVVENIDNPEVSSGLFFKTQTADAVERAINIFEKIENLFNPKWIQNHSRSFGEDVFQKKFTEEVDNLLSGS